MNTGVDPAVRTISLDGMPSAIEGVTGPRPLASTISVSPDAAGCDGIPRINPFGPAIVPSELKAKANNEGGGGSPRLVCSACSPLRTSPAPPITPPPLVLTSGVLKTPGAIGTVKTLNAAVEAPLTFTTTSASPLISHGT